MTTKQPRYSLEERGQVLARLAANNGNVKRTARQCGVSPQTVRRYRDAEREELTPAEAGTVERSALDEIQHLKRLYARRAADDGAINQTSGFYAVQAYQRLTELEQLLTGKPTQRIEATPYGLLLKEIRDLRQKRVSDHLTVLEGGKAAAS